MGPLQQSLPPLAQTPSYVTDHNHFVTKAVVYLTQRITLVNLQKIKLIYEITRKFAAVSFLMCSVATLSLRKSTRFHDKKH